MAERLIGQPTYTQPSMKEEWRHYVCPVCGEAKNIHTRRIEKSIVICAHPDSRGGVLPVIALREEGALIQ